MTDQTRVGHFTVYKFLDENGDLAFDQESDGMRIPEIIGLLQLTINRLSLAFWEND